MILGIGETFSKWGDQFRDFMIDNSRNPVLWIGLFFLGLVIFFITYESLNKNR